MDNIPTALIDKLWADVYLTEFTLNNAMDLNTKSTEAKLAADLAARNFISSKMASFKNKHSNEGEE